MAAPTPEENPNFVHTRSGVSAIIERNGMVIVGKRLGSHGAGKLQMPGGHIEKNEHPFKCAVRETFEETGLVVKAIKKGPWTSDEFEKEGKHYITTFVWCKMEDETAEPERKEKNKCEGWVWKSAQELRNDINQGKGFKPLENLLAEDDVENGVFEQLEKRAEAHEKSVQLAKKAKLAEQTQVDEQATEVEEDTAQQSV
ncbi:uncharacterized protein CCOS01_06389 [Colletotrichum costaricense]|uniref:Nudix hydrolase domain-containing protein n=1 Tax=Colletotrichum costaricense TaxID=1209916 RepID=A0AAJ0E264_9PEZI|nr:uncharacterized protein CCOS01_06389 [Colletotrichum costaricense]KAK1528555.1 hypothetical protein CCOS01_06389 [Colletotrichum costaricense]